MNNKKNDKKGLKGFVYFAVGVAAIGGLRWIIWMGLIFWIFLTPYSIPGERRKKDSPLDILKMRFASGEI